MVDNIYHGIVIIENITIVIKEKRKRIKGRISEK